MHFMLIYPSRAEPGAPSQRGNIDARLRSDLRGASIPAIILAIPDHLQDLGFSRLLGPDRVDQRRSNVRRERHDPILITHHNVPWVHDPPANRDRHIDLAGPVLVGAAMDRSLGVAGEV